MQQAKAKQAERAVVGADDKEAASRSATEVLAPTAHVSTIIRASSELDEHAPKQQADKCVEAMSLQSANESSDEEL